MIENSKRSSVYFSDKSLYSYFNNFPMYKKLIMIFAHMFLHTLPFVNIFLYCQEIKIFINIFKLLLYYVIKISEYCFY